MLKRLFCRATNPEKRIENVCEATNPLHTGADWRAVLNPLTGGYWEGFDRAAIHEFARHDWDDTHFFRLKDCSPYFNIAGLYFRATASQP